MEQDSEGDAAMRCVAVIDRALPKGKAANAAAVMALSLGGRQPQLIGEPLVDAGGTAHVGLIPIGIPVLGAPAEDLPRLCAKARAAGIEVVDFPVQGQETTDYGRFRSLVAATAGAELRYLGVMLYGERRKVGRLVGRYRLLANEPAAGQGA
ncbi:Protein of unknown function [Tistlia consotensis]|uniref:DUF2000 domain-containing protein n=1 Tax=Tistlia consotensis USBA 355 TaxID=560819 RepID=A0A1Y6CNK2_9PROT|nr:DUF2000 domain-containing protein [Tistlia consotensis]SMF76906.1 Protein of unknown function [Tistlia consotensis USBA 355]SNS13397.1 Protein of unknown function [Tistlia consotensis]